MSRARRGKLVGLAVDADRIVLVHRGADDTGTSVTVEWPYGAMGEAASRSLETALRQALEEANTELGPFASVAVALMPSLSDVRRVALPPLSDADLHLHLEGRAARYLPWPAGDWLAAPAAADAGPAGRWIAFGEGNAVRAVYRVAADLGLRVRCVTPAAIVWGVISDGPLESKSRQGAPLVVATAGGGRGIPNLHVLDPQPNGNVGYRRFPANDVGCEALASALSGDTPVHLMAPPDIAEGVLDALRGVGVQVTALGDNAPTDPAVAAARAVCEVDGPWLVPESLSRRRGRRERRLVGWLIAASVVFVMIAAGIRIWGLERELAAVAEERDAIHDVVAHALDARGRIDRLESALDLLDWYAADSPRWSVTLARLGATLPTSAYLTGLRGAGDTLQIDATATDAAEVFRALDAAAWLDGLEPLAAVRRETMEGEGMVERLTLAGQLVPISDSTVDEGSAGGGS